MRRWIALTLLGCVLVGLSLAGRYQQRHDNLSWFVGIALAQGIVYLVSVWVVLRDDAVPHGLITVLVFAALLRLVILFAPPYLSDDIYRYVWDGRVQNAGINPYRFVPEDPALQSLRDGEIYPYINRRDYAHTIYPPLAQMLFLGITRVSESVTWMKTCMVGCEAVVVWLLLRLLALLGLPAERVLIYVWHPLTVWEFAGSGHIDAAAIAFLAAALWARQRNFPALTGITLGAATLVKLYPAMLFPVLYRRSDWKMPAAFGLTIAASYAPYLSVGAGVFGYLPGYVREEGLREGWSIFPLNLMQHIVGEHWIGPTAYLAMSTLIVLAMVAWLVFRRETRNDWLKNGVIFVMVLYILISPHYPWYFAWPLLLLTVVPYLPMLYLTAASFILYETRLGESGAMLFRLNALLYVPLCLLIVVHTLLGRRPSRAEHSTGVGMSSVN
jgi:alpha-1,6-mannosyltransferase